MNNVFKLAFPAVNLSFEFIETPRLVGKMKNVNELIYRKTIGFRLETQGWYIYGMKIHFNLMNYWVEYLGESTPKWRNCKLQMTQKNQFTLGTLPTIKFYKFHP